MQNTHLDHFEERCLTNPQSLISLIKKLNAGKLSVSIKFDGAPSIVCGPHPKDGDFFVATKAFFNKRPIYYTSEEAITASALKPEVKKKLTRVFRCMRFQDLDYIVQGDYLFGLGELTRVDYSHVSFQPNLIVYTMPVHKLVKEADWQHQNVEDLDGFVWHTRYDKALQANFKPIRFRRPGIWNANVRYVGKVPKIDVQEVSDILSTIGTPIPAQEDRYLNLVRRYLRTKGHRNLDARECTRASGVDLENIFKTYEYLQGLKAKVMAGMDDRSGIGCSLRKKTGELVPTSHEGYVIGDRMDAVKLVDRNIFSMANQSDEYVKGWS